MTQEFYISVTPVRDSGFLVRTEKVEPGVPLAEEQIDARDWPVERWLEQATHLMHEPLVGLLRGSRTGTTLPQTDRVALDLVSLGQELYAALFRGTIRDSWMIAQGVAQSQKQVLRLRLGLKGNILPRLPWEVLHDGARTLATGADVAFSRYHSVMTAIPTAPAARSPQNEAPLSILMVLAAPTDQEVLQLQQESIHLKTELQQGNQSGKSAINLTILEQPGREELTQALEQGRYDILHYAGHSNLGMAGGDLYLVSDRTGLTEVLSGDDLAGLLANNGVHMAVFNSCRGVYAANATDLGNGIESLADALLKRGIPAVLAMAERIPDDVALNLSRLFYRNLKQRLPIDLSLNRARQGLLSSYGSDQLYWALPILYLHPEFDGFLQQGMVADGLMDELPDAEGFLEDYESFDLTRDLDDLDHPDQDDRAAVQDLFRELSGNGVSSNGASNHGASNGQRAQPTKLEEEAEDFLALGKKLQAQGDLTAAIAAYGDTIKLAPQSAKGYHHLGTALQQYGSLPEALTAYKMAVRIDPNLTVAQEHLQALLQGNGSVASGVSSGVSNGVSNGASSGASSEPTSPSRAVAKSPAESPLLKTVLTVGAIGSVITSLWWVSTTGGGRRNNPSKPPEISQTNPTNPAEIQTLINQATKASSENNLKETSEAVTALIEQGSIENAEKVLNNLTPTQRNSPVIEFLLGRVNWEHHKRKSRVGTVTDVWRYWEQATRLQPDSATYQNALGFAFYEVQRWDEASRAWSKAMDLVNKQQGKNAVSDPEMLTAQAGLALAYHKMGQQNSAQSRLLGKSISIRDSVLAQKSDDFSPIGLTKDWRWSEKAIADWRKLLDQPKP